MKYLIGAAVTIFLVRTSTVLAVRILRSLTFVLRARISLPQSATQPRASLPFRLRRYQAWWGYFCGIAAPLLLLLQSQKAGSVVVENVTFLLVGKKWSQLDALYCQ